MGNLGFPTKFSLPVNHQKIGKYPIHFLQNLLTQEICSHMLCHINLPQASHGDVDITAKIPVVKYVELKIVLDKTELTKHSDEASIHISSCWKCTHGHIAQGVRTDFPGQ